jgi:hypothetical protein
MIWLRAQNGEWLNAHYIWMLYISERDDGTTFRIVAARGPEGEHSETLKTFDTREEAEEHLRQIVGAEPRGES